MKKNLWTKEQDDFLREHWQEMSDEKIAKALGRSKNAVQTRRYKLGVAIDPAEWLPEEDDYILKH